MMDIPATHKTHPAEYSVWGGMKTRCLNPRSKDFYRYGGKGITIHPTWVNSFATFCRDMGPRPAGHSIDRFPDPCGNYEPGNCRWATAKEQGRNKSTGNNRLIAFQGRVLPLSQWVEELGINRGTIKGRLRAGWTITEALTEPPLPILTRDRGDHGRFA